MKSFSVKKIILSLLLVITFLTGCNSSEANKPLENKEPKAKVGISWAAKEVDPDIQLYADAVIKAGGEPVFLPICHNEKEAREVLKKVDALILTGGDDIDPSLYNENINDNLEQIYPVRDLSDISLLKVVLNDKNIPTLGTCRGMQLINVASGGTLYQDLPSQYNSEINHRDPERKEFVMHKINIRENSTLAKAIGKSGDIKVNSWHHQAIKDLGQNLEIDALAPDNIIEAITRTDCPFVVGVQYHPEDLIINNNDETSLNLYKTLIEEANKSNNY